MFNFLGKGQIMSVTSEDLKWMGYQSGKEGFIRQEEDAITLSLELYPDHKERDQEWIRIAQECRKIQEVRRSIEEKESLLIAQLKLVSKGMNSKGGGFIFTKTLRKGSIEYNRIPELKGIDLESYRKAQVESWKLDQMIIGD